MNREEVLYLAPYIFSLILSLGVFLYTWHHRNVRGAKAYSWFVAGQALTILGFIFELVSPNLQTKILWDKFQWLTDTFLVILPFLIFSIQFSEHKPRYPVILWGILGTFLIVFTTLFVTDNIHHLFYPNPHLNTEYPFPDLEYDFTGFVYFYTIFYFYGSNFYGIILLLRRAFQPNNLYRSQYIIISAGFLVTLILSILSLFDIKITPQRDITPFSFAIGNLIVAWGLFRYKLFNIVPIARERIVENMSDPVIVLDISSRIVDVNAAAVTLIHKQGREIIGKLPSEVFAEWPTIAELFKNPTEQRKEVSAEYGGDTIFFDVGFTAIHNSSSGMIGTIVVIHDITRHKALETGYRMLSEELDQRVQERTKQLGESAERYRALFEQTNDAIFILDFQGKHLDANQRAADMLGYTHEEIVKLSVRETSAELEQSAHVLERLLHGERIPVYERTFRKKNGDLIPVEINVELVHDINGNPLHIQSAVRDITERKQAEIALKQSEERFSKAFQENPVIIAITRISDGKLIEVNDTFVKITGYTREETLGKLTPQIGLWLDPDKRDRFVKDLLSTGKRQKLETQFKIKNGDILTCLISTEMIEFDGEECFIAVIEDITERINAEARIRRLNRLYVTISQINQTIVHAQDRNTLFRDICHVAIDHGKFRMAWIGLIDETGESVKPVAFAGEELGYLENIQIKLQDEVRGRGPTGAAIHEEHCIICQDNASDPHMAPWREAALSRGYRSSAAVPIRRQGKVFGALTVHADEPQGFTPEDEELLEQIGMDVSFAVDSIDTEQKRKRAEENLEEAYDTTLEGWAKALELRDKETEGHSRRVTATTQVVARAIGFSEAELVEIRRGSILHDIGKMGIPDEILRKNGPLTDSERQIVMKHPTTAYDLLKRTPFLEKALEIPYCHHEKWDGSGYPRGLKGTEIPLSARIFAVVDVWDALSSDRPYRKAWSQEKVVQYLLENTGSHFDPSVIEVFLKLLNEGKI